MQSGMSSREAEVEEMPGHEGDGEDDHREGEGARRDERERQAVEKTVYREGDADGTKAD